MDKIERPIVFLDTNVLMSAFPRYRKGDRLPLYLTDPEASRFTFEKCIFEAYMMLRGIAKECPKDAALDNSLEFPSLDIDYWLLSVPAPNCLMRADFLELSNTSPKGKKTGAKGEKRGPLKWAEKYLDKERDARTLNDLLNKYHTPNNKFIGNFWINNLDGNEDLIDFCEDMMMKNPEDKSICEDLSREIHVLKGLIRNRNLFEKLCNEFLKMLKDNNINILRYEDVFCIKAE